MTKRIVTVGNPNSGKTTLFNQLTGARQQVGNWAGVTVEKKAGQYTSDGKDIEVTDLPGIYSLDNSDEINSLDESIAVKALFSGNADLIINVVDATCLERSLYLTVQLLELGEPMVVLLNKMDALNRQGQKIDIEKLSKQLKCPVFCVSANDHKQVQRLKKDFDGALGGELASDGQRFDYGDSVEHIISQVESAIFSVPEKHRRASAVRLVTGDQLMAASLSEDEISLTQRLIHERRDGEDIDLLVASARYTWVAEVCKASRQTFKTFSKRVTNKIDQFALNRVLGMPIFFGVMYLMFMFSINIGSAFIDFFDISVGALLVEGGHVLVDGHLPVWLVTLLVDGVGGGIQTVSTFIPVIGCLYLFMSLLESSGYMARAAFVLDYFMQKIGLPGKAFVPLVLGFGCNVPAIMATRTLDQERERKLSAAMAPFMSCGARLPVYALFAAAFFQESAQNVVFSLYLAGIFVAILTGVILRKTLYPGESDSLVMEMPEYEWPKAKNVLIKTWNKLKRFVLGAGKTIVVVVTLLTFANSLSMDGTFGHSDTEQSVLAKAAQVITPVFSPIGIQEDNWQATVGIITGIFAKEAVVGTLNSLYSDHHEPADKFSLKDKLTEAVQTIPEKLLGIKLSDPMGLKVDSDQQAIATEQGVDMSIFSNLQKQFSPAAAFSYLVFILLYTPCVAAMGAYVREFGRQFSLFIASWTMLQAFVFSVVTYQILNFAVDPAGSAMWITIAALMMGAAVLIMRELGNRQHSAGMVYDSL